MSDKIMVDRSVLEKALEVLSNTGTQRGREPQQFHAEGKSIEALRSVLEQPQVEPELLEALKQVEHQLRWLDHPALDAAREAIAKTIEQPQDIAYQEAVHLAKWLFKKHFAHEEDYASGRVVWEPCDTTAGVISQIDNMVCTLVRPKSEDDKEYDWRDLYQKQKRRAEMWIAKYEKDVGMLDVAVPVCTHQQPVDDIVAGALFDFMGWLTTRSERLVLSSTDLATPAVDAIVEFAEMRGLCLNDAQVKDWKDKTHAHIASSLKPIMSQR